MSAQIYYVNYSDGSKQKKEFHERVYAEEFLKSLREGNDPNAYISYKYTNTSTEDYQGTIRYFDSEGYLHRDDGPAFSSVRSDSWYRHGKLHNSNGPASIIYFDDDKKKISSEDWFENDQQHREDGPSSIDYYEDGSVELEDWYFRGKSHRIGGPNFIHYDESGQSPPEGLEWFVNGVEYTEEEYWLVIWEKLSLEEQTRLIFNGFKYSEE